MSGSSPSLMDTESSQHRNRSYVIITHNFVVACIVISPRERFCLASVCLCVFWWPYVTARWLVSSSFYLEVVGCGGCLGWISGILGWQCVMMTGVGVVDGVVVVGVVVVGVVQFMWILFDRWGEVDSARWLRYLFVHCWALTTVVSSTFSYLGQ